MERVAGAVSSAGNIVSCDPNIRLSLWADPQELKILLGRLLPLCTVVKLSLEELEFVTEQKKPEDALASLQKMGVLLPIVTLGAEGAMLLFDGRWVRVPSPAVDVVDTTGAGDGFMAGFLYGLSTLYAERRELERAGVGELRELATFACAVASRVCTQLGAQRALPQRREVEAALPPLLQEAFVRVP
jgi:fructokinase